MAIFDKEKEFYKHPAPPLSFDQSFIYQVADLVDEHIYKMNVPVSILVCMLDHRPRSYGLLGLVVVIITMYFFLIALPKFAAAIIASPVLLAWKSEIFERTFKVIFIPAYIFCLFFCSSICIDWTTNALNLMVKNLR